MRRYEALWNVIAREVIIVGLGKNIVERRNRNGGELGRRRWISGRGKVELEMV
jgi:hypothetical protein